MGDFAEQQRKQYYNTVTVKLGYNKWLHYFQTNPLYVVFFKTGYWTWMSSIMVTLKQI